MFPKGEVKSSGKRIPAVFQKKMQLPVIPGAGLVFHSSHIHIDYHIFLSKVQRQDITPRVIERYEFLPFEVVG